MSHADIFKFAGNYSSIMVEASAGRIRAVRRAAGEDIEPAPTPVAETEEKWYPGIERDKEKEAMYKEILEKQDALERRLGALPDTAKPTFTVGPDGKRWMWTTQY